MTRRLASVARCCTCAAGLLLGVAPDGRAQSAPARVEVSALALAATGASLGTSRATLLGNNVPTGTPVTLLDASTRVGLAPIGEARIGVRLVRGFLAEAGVSYARPELQVRLSNDIEGADNITASTRLTQVTVDGALVHRWHVGRAAPFVLAGGGYLRQLDGPRTSVGTGHLLMAGGGLLYGLGKSRARGTHRLSLRGDVRLVAYRGGLIIENDRPVGVVAGGGLTLALW